jgi:LacI family fructose operon transcriptional repressor
MNTSFQTIDEVAQALALSVTTVRLVLSGQAERYRISAGTRKRVEDYVAAHPVMVNHAARSLRLQRSDTIGLVVPNLGNPFFARLMAELESRCQADNLMLLTASSHENPELEARAVRKLLDRGIDGLVLAPCRKPQAALFARHLERVAVVLVDRSYPGTRFPLVLSDNRASAHELARRLLREAGNDVLFLCAQTTLPSIHDRVQGFRDALAEAGLDGKALLVDGGASDLPDTGARLLGGHLERGAALPRALVCSSLVVLEGALQALRDRLGQLPPELLIGTFDTEAMLPFLPNRVLAVVQDEAGIAQRAYARLRAGGKDGLDVVACRLDEWN